MAVAFDAKSTADVLLNSVSSGTVSGASLGLTIGSGSNRAVVFLIQTGQGNPNGRTVSSVTWDSGGTNQAATLIGRQTLIGTAGGHDLDSELWGLVAPTSGNKSLAFVLSGIAADVNISAVSFTGVDQTGGATSFPHFTGANTGTTISLTITSATGNQVVSGLVIDSTNISTISGNNIFIDNAGAVSGAAGTYASGASTVTITSSPNQVYAIAGCDVLAAGAAASNPFLPNLTVNPNLRVTDSQYWLEDNTYLIGKDTVNPGKQYYLNPNPPDVYRQYWLENNTYLIGLDKLITGKQQTTNPTIPLPRGNPDWQDEFFLGLSGKDSTVFGRIFTVNPVLPILKNPDWEDWITPLLVGQDSSVFGRQSGPNPTLPTTPNQYWIWIYNNGLNTVITNPIFPPVWALPLQPTRIMDWQDEFFLGLIGKDALVTGQQYTANPVLPVLKNPDWEDWFYLGLQGADSTVFGRIAGPNPVLPVLKPIDWQWFSTNTAIIIPTNPIFPPLWFVPKGADSKVQDWVNALNLVLVGKDQLIVGEQTFNVPVYIPRNPTDWQNFFELPLQQNLPPGKTQNLNPNLPIQPQFFILPLSQTLNIAPTFPVVTPSSIPSQFPPVPTQQNFYTIDWTNLLPPFVPPVTVTSGRFTPDDEWEAVRRHWREKERQATAELKSAARELGRLGGLIGGPARAAALTNKQRATIATNAAKARWKK